MKKTMLITIAALLFGTAGAQAQDKVTLQLKWVVQAQFAGYLVAKDKGFYKEAGLDVTIKPGGPDIAPPQVIAGGQSSTTALAGSTETAQFTSLETPETPET